VRKAIGLLTALVLTWIPTNEGTAKTAPSLTETYELIGIAMHWDFAETPFPGVTDPEAWACVALAEPGIICVTPIPAEYGSAAEIYGKGLRLWVDGETLEALHAPPAIGPVVIRPVAVAVAGEAAYGTIEALGDDFIELSAISITEERAEGTLRFAVPSGIAVTHPLEVGAWCYIVYDAADAALMVMLANG